MKKKSLPSLSLLSLFAFTLILLLTAVAVHAATVSISVTVTAAQNTKIQNSLTHINNATCVSLGLAKGCTQLQATAKDPTAVIYADAIAYGQGQLQRTVDAMVAASDVYDLQDVNAAFAAATPANQATCKTAIGLP